MFENKKFLAIISIAVVLLIIIIAAVIMKLPAVPAGAPPTSAPKADSLKIIAPNGFETLMAGQSFPVRWQANGVAKVTIIAKCANGVADFNGGKTDTIDIATNIAAGNNKFDWAVDKEKLNVSGQQVKYCKITISGSGAGGKKIEAVSKDFFNVVPFVEMPAIR